MLQTRRKRPPLFTIDCCNEIRRHVKTKLPVIRDTCHEADDSVAPVITTPWAYTHRLFTAHTIKCGTTPPAREFEWCSRPAAERGVQRASPRVHRRNPQGSGISHNFPGPALRKAARHGNKDHNVTQGFGTGRHAARTAVLTHGDTACRGVAKSTTRTTPVKRENSTCLSAPLRSMWHVCCANLQPPEPCSVERDCRGLERV